jgi:NAD(P)-dependent dehydrogenase (short-subunit alcohol dehydrogenase family)
MRLSDKVALVTASTGGIGESIAARLGAEGATVIVSGRSEEKGKHVVQSLHEAGAKAEFIACDVGNEDSVRALIDTISQRHSALHILVNNAGPTDVRGDDADRPLLELPVSVFEKLLHVGVMSMVHTCKYAIPLMQRAGGGAIVNVSSTASVVGIAGMPAYAASKGAMNALTRQLAVDYGPEIRVNALIVGQVNANERSQRLRADPVIGPALQQQHSTRLGEREDVAAAAAFLASDVDAGFITGSLLHVEGGSTAKLALPNPGSVARGTGHPPD